MGPSPTQPHPAGNGTRAVSPDRRPDTCLGPALRVRPLAGCPGWTGSPCSWGWPWPWSSPCCSYAVSATSLYALGVQAGYSWWQAAAVPVVADGPAIYGMFRIVSRSRRGAKGAGYGWLLVGCGTAGLDRRQRRPRPTRPGRPGHRRRHPPGRAGHAGRAQGRRRRGHPPGRPGRRPGPRGRAHPARPAPARHHRPTHRPHRQPGHRGGGTRLPAACAARRARARPTAPRSGRGCRRPMPSRGRTGRPWTARTLAEAAGCGRSSAASFLQRQRPPAAERTQ